MKTSESLKSKHCKPCHGETKPSERREAEAMLASIPGWSLDENGRYLRRSWKVRDFMAGIGFFQEVAELAESEDHHPDLHLENYRDVTIRLTTHAIKGLSENDFILAAKINDLPVQLKET
jgi:4a-hydroxytetrahydrobiopterin dehydratase